jgi:prepilin-type N-terminal cleavage/methylation domain-containing protein
MKGFTLIELLVVSAITVLIAGFLIANFSRTRVDLNQTTSLVQDAIRSAQSMALAGTLYGHPGTYRCGYGIHFLANGYIVYAGPNASSVDCTTQSRTYSSDADDIVNQSLFSNAVLEIAPPLPDIFFEPPNPTTYINGSSAVGLSVDVNVRRQGASCPSVDCRTIHVTTSGQIQ